MLDLEKINSLLMKIALASEIQSKMRPSPFLQHISSHVSMPQLFPLALSIAGECGARGCSQSVSVSLLLLPLQNFPLLHCGFPAGCTGLSQHLLFYVMVILFPPLCSEFLSRTLFLTLCCYATLEPFLKSTFAEAPPLWLLGPAMPCGQNRLCLAQGSPHLPAGTWTRNNFNT